MYGWHNNGWWLGFLMMVLILVAVVLVVWLLTRSVTSGERSQRPPEPRTDLRPDAMDILRERFARGEIDAEEFEARRSLLERGGQ